MYRAYRNTISWIDPNLNLNAKDPLAYFNEYRRTIKNDFSNKHEEKLFFTYEDVLINNTTWLTVEDYIKDELYKTKSITEILTKFVLDENKYEIVPSKKAYDGFLETHILRKKLPPNTITKGKEPWIYYVTFEDDFDIETLQDKETKDILIDFLKEIIPYRKDFYIKQLKEKTVYTLKKNLNLYLKNTYQLKIKMVL